MAVVNLGLHCFKSDLKRRLLTHYFDSLFDVYAVKDPLISEEEKQLMSVGGVY